MRTSTLLLHGLASVLLSTTSVNAVHHSSHEIVRRADGQYEARELLTAEERQRDLQRRQSVGDGGAGVGIAGAQAGIGNVTLKIGNIKVTTGELLLEDIHIGDITVLVDAGVSKRDTVPKDDDPIAKISGLPSFAPGQIPDGPVQAVIVAGETTKIYIPPTQAATSGEAREATGATTASVSSPTIATKHSSVAAAVAVVTASPSVHQYGKRQNVSVGPVSASVGPIGVGIGNVNVTVGDVNVKLGDLTVKNVTIGNILVSVKINAAHAIETLVGVLPSLVSDVTGAVGGVTGGGKTSSSTSTSTSSSSANNSKKTHSVNRSDQTKFVKERRSG